MNIHADPGKHESYVRYEVERNHRAKPVFQALLKRAFGPGSTVIISHHLTVMCPKGVVHEIPSADTILFDHDIMHKVFGNGATNKMRELAAMRAEWREGKVEEWLGRMDRAAPQVLTRATKTDGDEKRRKQRAQPPKEARAADTRR